MFSLACLVLLGVIVMAVTCKIHRQEKRPVSADALINGYVYRLVLVLSLVMINPVLETMSQVLQNIFLKILQN